MNEHGDFLGLVSLEDLLEEIIGEFNKDIPSKLSKILRKMMVGLLMVQSQLEILIKN